MTKVAYHTYFGCVISDQDRNWAPHICYHTCAANLSNWLNGKRSAMPFAVPLIPLSNHFNDSYFCMTKVTGFSRKSKHNIQYPNIPSAIRPVLHREVSLVPVPPANWEEDLEMWDDKAEPDNVLETDGSYLPESEETTPHLIEQAKLNDPFRHLHLPKEHAELLASRLQQWNLLATGTKETIFRNRKQQ